MSISFNFDFGYREMEKDIFVRYYAANQDKSTLTDSLTVKIFIE